MAVENDVVLIHFEDKPLLFARIERIIPDHKPNWYHVSLLLLQIPPQLVTWILRDVYIDGEEFTMNGQRMRLERVESPVDTLTHADKESQGEAAPVKPEGKIISFTDIKKDK
jgi:hypothetical protein